MRDTKHTPGAVVGRREALAAVLAAGIGGAVTAAVVTPDSSTAAYAADPATATESVGWIGTTPAAAGAADYPNLRNLTGVAGQVVVAKGFWTPGDGAGGVFYWDTAGVVEDYGTAVVPAAAPAGSGWRRLDGRHEAGKPPVSEVNLRWFGARGNLADSAPADQIAQETAAVRRALDAVASGGTLVVPAGRYLMNQTLDLTGSLGVRVTGQAGRGTAFVYTQPHGSLLRLLSTANVTFENLTFAYADTKYDGVLVDQNRIAPDAGDTSYIRYVSCTFASTHTGTVTSAPALLRLTGSICCTVQDCFFLGAHHGIVGRAAAGAASFSNAMDISGCVFAHLDGYGVYTPGESWTIRDCTFEPDDHGRAVGISTDPALGGAWGLQITGNWFGDMSAPGKDWITVFTYGGLIAGNFVYAATNQGQYAVKLVTGCQGVTITGNRFNLPIAFGDNAGDLVHGVTVVGNDFGSSAAPVARRTNAQKLVWLGNWDSAAFEQIGEGLHVTGYLSSPPGGGLGIGIVSGQRLMPKDSVSGAVTWLDTVTDVNGHPISEGTVALIGRSDTATAEAAVFVGRHPTSHEPYPAQRWGGAAGVPGVPGAGGTPWSFSPLYVNSVGAPLASTANLVPTGQIHHITGTATITRIYPPGAVFSQNGGRITLIPDAAWSTDTGGNIARATTAIPGRPLELTWDGMSWWPSY